MTASDAQMSRLGFRGHGRALMVLALPLVGSHLAQFAIQITDTVMMGWYNVEGLAGLVLAGTFYFVFFLVGSGFAWAVMPMVASAAGTRDDAQVRRVTRMGLWLSAAFGALAMIPMIWAEPLLLAIGQPPAAARQGGMYLQIAALGLIPNLLIMVLKSYLAALEHTRVILVATIATAILNGFLNYALIFGNWGVPELGIRGAAIASVLLQILGLVWLVVYANVVTPQYTLFQNLHRRDGEALMRVFQLGWPIGLTSLAEVGLFSATSVMLGWIGILELAAHGVALHIISVLFMIHVGLSNAVTVRTGKAFGRNDAAHLRDGAKVALLISASIALATIVLLLAIPDLLVGLFVKPTDPDRPAIVAIGVSLLAVAAVFQVMDAAQVLALGLLRGVQDTKVPMVIAGVSYWIVGLPASYVLGFSMGYGAPGVWWGLVIGLAGAGALLNYRFWTRASRLG